MSNSPLCENNYNNEDIDEVTDTMITNLEERLKTCNQIYKSNAKTNELRYKEQITELETLIGEFTKISTRYRNLISNDNIDSVISQEIDKIFGL